MINTNNDKTEKTNAKNEKRFCACDTKSNDNTDTKRARKTHAKQSWKTQSAKLKRARIET